MQQFEISVVLYPLKYLNPIVILPDIHTVFPDSCNQLQGQS